ncbi:GGDEF domain-containing protein [Fundidesulfovibrio agrisoli]|uniref:GGDEF domain-containing protein n=1 Tax=Fundidesulfovibrio agrisoli TaxID=2922717 RepID=UPI001FAD638C|nr:GGDEF domain-containing protein [Fundidesulfovibrio agrisoli]
MIDLNTALLLGFLLQFAMGMVMVLAYTLRAAYPGFRSWTFALICWVFAGGSFYARSVLGEMPSVVLTNGLYFTSILLFYSGLARFYGFDRDRSRQRQNFFVALSMYAVVLCFLFVKNDLHVRVLLNSLTMGVLMVRTGLDALRGSRGRCLPIQRLLSWCFFVLAALLVCRGLMVWFMSPEADILRQGSGLLPLLVGNILSIVVMVFCLITLTSCRLEEELLQAQERLREQAQHDGLTGLFNRRHFSELAAQAARQAKRYKQPLSVILFDMDGFKNINDTFGHAIGDDVLRTAAATCRKVLRQADVAARWGGEEFAVLLPQTGLAGALETAERLRECLEGQRAGQAGELAATASFGVASLTGDEDVEGLLLRADAYLYEAKRDGRNRVKAQTPGRG